MTILPHLSLWNLGRRSYKEALSIQNSVAAHIKTLISEDKTPSGTVLLVEHDPVYTVGLRTKQYTERDEEKLKQLGAEFYKTDRGGLITFHGPGQLVVYPIINLKIFKPSVKWYVSNIENVVIDICRQYGLKAETSPHTGVWVGDKKICAIGIHGSRYVTTHGFALNCSTELEWFTHIVPCGIEGKGVTSISEELGEKITPGDVLPQLIDCFAKGFNCSLGSLQDYTNVEILLKSIH
ncbi:putative lipoyltransferase 2, mitochondrial [Macrosteles quadrilineatus]|uniref:putative lipoyltransferase 2, mitochondrial n=1 Tax=Macrosteles quadrilineatus TaxID=74068 RepID=UPI0023E1A846|nr:putative lipoyltransferase 2, mitochondrial [Macrosteles quadrilineatus]XP_054277334.1 putative lipoyltransferase 2, mitochondrial [Macrosteles quadrilineatus]XP_054277335.1 putative lipoyltransferase 2, mitochondrial [Macrosteles quadrilineatus]XP_054277336.1 putative lipoyltransferase 2, mitochondrial [Macrosteles quadrilineatus]XP_054277337.1 putative lipoyltransferase 2, mitochondrial [Macrosteles quadrilineatus]XP_054277338.1 putative lipoyltransferase 2, mitochondrial [Macrosteles qua